jgi:chemotaxis protein CheD
MADCRIGRAAGQVVATYALGSCIGLAVHDTATGVGGILHLMLPDSTMNPARGEENPWVFADTGIPKFLTQLYELGASKRRLTAYAVGGAQLMDKECVFEIGKRNHLAVRKLLWKAGILLKGENVGGSHSRSIKLEIGTGRLWLLEHGAPGEPAAVNTGGERWRIVS